MRVLLLCLLALGAGAARVKVQDSKSALSKVQQTTHAAVPRPADGAEGDPDQWHAWINTNPETINDVEGLTQLAYDWVVGQGRGVQIRGPNELQAKMFRLEVFTTAPCCCGEAARDGMFSNGGILKYKDGTYGWEPTRHCFDKEGKTDSDGNALLRNETTFYMRDGVEVEKLASLGAKKYKCPGLQDSRGLCFHHEKGNALQKRLPWLRKLIVEAQAEKKKDNDETDAFWDNEVKERFVQGSMITKAPVGEYGPSKKIQGVLMNSCPAPTDICDIALIDYDPPVIESISHEKLWALQDSNFNTRTSYHVGGYHGEGLSGKWSDHEWDAEDKDMFNELMQDGNQKRNARKRGGDIDA